MYLTRHHTPHGPRWAADGRYLPVGFTWGALLALPQSALAGTLAALQGDEHANGAALAPLEPMQEVWASGVTYLRSRDARQAESVVGDVYARVYAAERPELFFKAPGWRVAGDGDKIRIRPDSTWNVPEPELVVIANRLGEIVAYTAGNDVSSRSIEGENPLYLPQAKVYTGACAVGPGILLAGGINLQDIPIQLEIQRGGAAAFQAQTSSAQMKRQVPELVKYLYRELDFPTGAYLMTGTGIVPPESFTLQVGDTVTVKVGELTLRNEVRG